MSAGRVDAFVRALGLPEPDEDADAMLDAIEEGRGAAAVDAVLTAFGARRDAQRYRTLLADPELALETTWRYAGAATRALLVALEGTGVLDGARRVLDLGSGEGVVPAYVAWSRPGTEVLATDLRPEAGGCVARLAERLGLPRLGFERVSLRRPPARLREAGWDVVLAFRVLHELGGRDAALPLVRAFGAPTAVVAERAVDRPGDAELHAAAARAGLRVDALERVPVRELDAHGAFPLLVLRASARRDGARLGR